MTIAPATATVRLIVSILFGWATLGWAATAVAAPSPLLGATPHARSAASVAGRTGATPWSWPLVPVPRIVHPFDKPPTPYAAGHRGVDLAGSAAQAVLAVDDGIVTHVGVLAGRGTVTIQHATGLRSTYEPLATAVRRGQIVTRGQQIGTLDTALGHCLPSVCLHVGALRQGTSGEWDYVDPVFLLVPVAIILLPTG